MIRVNARLRRAAFMLNVDFRAESRVTGVFGPSGAGKTTLMHAIAGLETPDQGEVAIGDTVLFDSTRNLNLPIHQRGVGIVFQEHRLFPHLTVRANLNYGIARAAHTPRISFDHAVDLLELAPLLDRKPAALSGGEKQRVALGRALLSNPRVLLMDEPLVSLDARLKRQIVPFLKRTIDAAQVPVLYVSHDLAEIQQLTDTLLLLDRGQIIGHGAIADLAFAPRAQAILGLTHESTSTSLGGFQNVLPARIAEHHPDQGTTICAVTPQSQATLPHFVLPAIDLPIDTGVSILISPRDIALATQPVTGISIQNQIPTVVRRAAETPAACLIELDAGVPIMVEISRAAAKSLDIHPGRPLVMLIKSQAIRLR